MSDIYLGTLTALIGVIGTLTAICFKYYLDRKKHEDVCIVNRTITEIDEMSYRLDELKDEINADRISIMSFHNGGEYYSGKSMQKFSCSYEVVNPGISRSLLDLQNIPVAACLPTLRTLIRNKEFHCDDVTADYPESFCKFKLLENGVKSTYQYVILDLKKNAIGILRADFVTKKVKLSRDGHVSLRHLAIKLPGYLSK